MSGLKRIALVLAIISLLLFADGAQLLARHNQVGGDTGLLFGNPHFFLSAGTVVLISGGLLLLGAVIMWAVALRLDRPAGGRGQVKEPQARPAADQSSTEQTAHPGGRTASQA
jgi:hypothetical protein